MSAKKIIVISAIIIVLAVAVLLLISLNKPKPDTVFTQCAFACQSGQKTSFCLVERTLSNGQTATCDQLSTNSQYSAYNVSSCPSISCTISAQETARLNNQTCVGIGGTWQTPVNGECPQSRPELVRKLNPTDSPPVTGQICCG